MMPEYQWKLVASRWAGNDPDRLVRLAEVLLSAFGNLGIFVMAMGKVGRSSRQRLLQILDVPGKS